MASGAAGHGALLRMCCHGTGIILPPAALLMGEAKSCPPLLAGAWLLWETCGFPLAMG